MPDRRPSGGPFMGTFGRCIIRRALLLSLLLTARGQSFAHDAPVGSFKTGPTLLLGEFFPSVVFCGNGEVNPTCTGGDNAGQPCTSGADCPGGTCGGETCILCLFSTASRSFSLLTLFATYPEIHCACAWSTMIRDSITPPVSSR